MAATHKMRFKRKVRHMHRHGFNPIPREHDLIDYCASKRCPCCGWVGLGYYPYSGPGWNIQYWESPTTHRTYSTRHRCRIVRMFVVCDGCGYWREMRKVETRGLKTERKAG